MSRTGTSFTRTEKVHLEFAVFNEFRMQILRFQSSRLIDEKVNLVKLAKRVGAAIVVMTVGPHLHSVANNTKPFKRIVNTVIKCACLPEIVF